MPGFRLTHEQEFELFDGFPLTDNDAAATHRVAAAFADFFGDRARPMAQQTASEDFSDIPPPRGALHLLGHRRHRPRDLPRGRGAGRVAQDIPVNHSPNFAPVLQPTLEPEPQALVVAALAGLAR